LETFVTTFIVSWPFNFGWDEQSVGRTIRGTNIPGTNRQGYEQSPNRLETSMMMVLSFQL